MVFTMAPTIGVSLRPYTRADVQSMLTLINVDRLPGSRSRHR